MREPMYVSHEKLSMMADIFKNQIYNLENGKNNCTICTIKAIAEALNVPPKDLLDF
ncbi:MAG: helix-turn-helix transcriptional regulator [Chitinophagales bacterium]|nr:helix-turn-helix transcriptional regulator [Chitinophagales bacterium]